MTDSLRTRGENVSAWEVENTFALHPAVEHCAVVGVPSELGEQDILLFVVPAGAVPVAARRGTGPGPGRTGACDGRDG